MKYVLSLLNRIKKEFGRDCTVGIKTNEAEGVDITIYWHSHGKPYAARHSYTLNDIETMSDRWLQEWAMEKILEERDQHEYEKGISR